MGNMRKAMVTHPVDYTKCKHEFRDFVGHAHEGESQRYYCPACDSLWFVFRTSTWWEKGNERPQGRADQ